MVAASAGASAADWTPDGVFLQYGNGRHSTESIGVGAVWNWGPQWAFAGGAFSGYWDASASRWRTTNAVGGETRYNSQIGITPVFRFRGDGGASRWFVEAGIGANLISPIYNSGSKHFSTTFNFGDQIGAGYDFGAKREHEVSLRMQHFSNAGISEPNPGENFFQLRYTYKFN
jgi:hypothetical protein